MRVLPGVPSCGAVAIQLLGGKNCDQKQQTGKPSPYGKSHEDVDENETAVKRGRLNIAEHVH